MLNLPTSTTLVGGQKFSFLPKTRTRLVFFLLLNLRLQDSTHHSNHQPTDLQINCTNKTRPSKPPIPTSFSNSSSYLRRFDSPDSHLIWTSTISSSKPKQPNGLYTAHHPLAWFGLPTCPTWALHMGIPSLPPPKATKRSLHHDQT